MGFEWLPPKNYKRHFICLKCQKGFKRPSKEDMSHSESTDLSDLMIDYYSSGAQQDIIKYINASHRKLKVVCPNCRNQMVQVHYDFEVPPQRDNKSWKKLQNTMDSKTVINYEIYLNWHHLELHKTVVGSNKFKVLEQNSERLKKISAK